MTRPKTSFTLLEVILCVSIVSIGLVTLVGGFSLIAQANATVSNYTKAMFLIQGKIADIEREGLSISQEGVFDDPFQKFSWTLEKGSFVSGKVRLITLSLNWKEQARSKNITITTLIREKE